MNGNILSKTDSTNTANILNWSYGYDVFNRLTTSGETTDALTYSYLYDKNGNRTQKTENLTTDTYGYETNTNRLNLINTVTINRDR